MSVEQYLDMQKRSYAGAATSRENAEKVVHPFYNTAAREARATLAYLLNDYMDRHATLSAGRSVDRVRKSFLDVPRGLRLLDYGCGVGRVMDEVCRSGFRVDGVDISPEMLAFAAESSILRKSGSRLFLSGGQDCGEAPAGSYDLAYSVLCFQHICVRTVRTAILRSIARALKPDGSLFIQFQFYPTFKATTIPENHAAWDQDKTSAVGTNSQADVWVTPDRLAQVWEDFSAIFHDVRFQFIEIPNLESLEHLPYGARFQHLFVSACNAQTYCERIYRAL
ncbi:MAG: class I SAM-dependent methyltransferase [Planctomycetota bacterium]